MRGVGGGDELGVAEQQVGLELEGELRRVLTGVVRGTCGAWAAAGPELARIRLEANRLNKERARALYANDDDRLASLEEELQELVARAHGVLGRSRRRASEERRAVARTVIVTPARRDDA